MCFGYLSEGTFELPRENIGTWKSATTEEDFIIPRRKYYGVFNKHGENTML